MYDETVKRLKNCATQAAPCLTCDMTDDGSCIETLMKQAADAIEEILTNYDAATDIMKHQTEYIEELEAKLPRWIPVTERLPEGIDEEVLVCTEDYGVSDLGFVTVATYGDNEWLECWERRTYLTAVTHWMPLPEPPKEK